MKFYDSEGNEIEIEKLVRQDPERAASIIKFLCAEKEQAHEALHKAGVAVANPYVSKELTLTERINLLARRSVPHESPDRTAYVAGLERAALEVLKASHLLTLPDAFSIALLHLHEATRDRAPCPGCERVSQLEADKEEIDKQVRELAAYFGEKEVRRVLHVVSPRQNSNPVRCSECERVLSEDCHNPESQREWYEAGHHVCGRDTEPPVGAHSDADNLCAWRRWAGELIGHEDELFTDDGMRQEIAKIFARDTDALKHQRDLMSHDIEVLRIRNQHLTDKLVRISELTGPFPAPGSVSDSIQNIVTEQLQPYDSLAAELARENMLMEIDGLLSAGNACVGGRLDSIKVLIHQRNGMRVILRNIAEWIERDGAAIRSWLEDR